jgi:TalC/MipB family fructose-6-phosphate aldolase
MALYVDCALLEEVATVCARYPVAGVTTNPTILRAAAERGQRLSDLEVLRELLGLCSGEVFMQPMTEMTGQAADGGNDAEALRAAAERYIAQAPERVVPKLPPTPVGLAAGRALGGAGARIAFTAVCSLPQAYCATQAHAAWIIPYFGRLRRAGEDPCERIGHMARLLGGQEATTRILAASVKSPADLIDATLAGAHDITAPPEVIHALLADPLTDAALEQFRASWDALRATCAMWLPLSTQEEGAGG